MMYNYYIYFVQAGESGPIKIGLARSPKDRIKQLQAANHEELRLIAVCDGNHRKERQFHEAFAADHIHGEWFKPSAELLALTDSLGLPKFLRSKPKAN